MCCTNIKCDFEELVNIPDPNNGAQRLIGLKLDVCEYEWSKIYYNVLEGNVEIIDRKRKSDECEEVTLMPRRVPTVISYVERLVSATRETIYVYTVLGWRKIESLW